MPDHRRHFVGVGDVATDANRLMAGGDQIFGSGPGSVLVDIRQGDGCSRLREGFGRRQTNAGSGTCDERNFVFEGQVHERIPLAVVGNRSVA